LADVVIYDEATFKVLQYLKSVHTPSYEGRNDVLFNPDMPSGVPLKHLKVSGGLVVEMTQQEKDDLAAAEAAAADASMRTSTKALMDDLNSLALSLRVIIDMTIKELNILRGWLDDFKTEVAAATSLSDLQTRVAGLPDTPDRTMTQFKTTFKDTVDDKTAD
jgi:hypothetical protein